MSYALEIIGQIGIYVILAMSLNIICGLTGLLQLGHAGFFAIGAYAAALVSVYTYSPQLGALNFVLGAVAGMAAAAVFAVVIGIPCLRLSGDYLAIATLGFGEIVRISLNNIQFPGCRFTDGEPFGGSTGIDMIPLDPDAIAFDVDAFYGQWWFIWIIALIVYILLLNLKHSSVGRAFLAIRENEIAARAMGINVARYKLLSFVLCAVFAGLAGVLFAHSQLLLTPNDFSLIRSIEILLMVVLGGLGSFSGAGLAAIILIGLPQAIGFLPQIGGDDGIDIGRYRQLIFAVLLILLVRFVPHGIMGLREFTDWFRRSRPPEQETA